MLRPQAGSNNNWAPNAVPSGFVVKPRPTVPNKPIFKRACELLSVVQWTTGFLFMGISCFVIFVYLMYSIGKHILLLVLFTVSVPSRGRSALEVMQWSTCEACYFALTATLTTCYIRHWQHDLGAEERGSHPWKTMRHLNIWEQLANYFPIQLILSEELLECVESRRRTTGSAGDWQPYIVAGLPADRNYLVGYHPHGVFSTGAFVNFMTEANEFSKVFPGLTPWLATLKAHFKSPFYREYLMSLGMVSASKRSLRYLLDEKERKCTGNFVIVVVGGATEALEAHPRHYRMVVTKRFGFFKLALQTGSTLIPCLSFGEQAMYNQIPNEPGTRLRRFQDWFESVCTFSPPLFYARGLIPYRTPVNTVVGAPIPCKRIEDPTPKQVCEVKQMYLDSLQGLFWKYKSVYDPKAEDIVFL